MKPGSRTHRLWLAWVEFAVEIRVGTDTAWIEREWSLPLRPWRLYCRRHGHSPILDATFCRVCQTRLR